MLKEDVAWLAPPNLADLFCELLPSLEGMIIIY
jgi:hypothetical protein